MTQLWDPPLMMLQIKDQWFKTQYCSEWTYWTVWQACSIPLSQITKPELCEFIILFQVFYWLASYVCKSETSGSRPKVPFAVTSHNDLLECVAHLLDQHALQFSLQQYLLQCVIIIAS